jgi:hypothetical protein
MPHTSFCPTSKRHGCFFLDPAEAGLDRLQPVMQPQASSGGRPSSVRALRTAAQ